MGQGALRVLGVPFGLAECAGRMLFWSQAVHGGAVEFLIANQDSIAQHATLITRVVHHSKVSALLDAVGQCAFAVAPSALDLASDAAYRTGIGLAAIGNVAGVEHCGWIADRAAERGYVCVVSYASAPSRSGGYLAWPEESTLLAWAGERAPSGHALMLAAARAETHAALLGALSSASVSRNRPTEMIEPLLDGLIEPAVGAISDRGSLAVLCLTAERALIEAVTASTRRHIEAGAPIGSVDVRARRRDALTRGVWVEEGTADAFLALGRRLWLPTSERSRRQGSDINDTHPLSKLRRYTPPS